MEHPAPSPEHRPDPGVRLEALLAELDFVEPPELAAMRRAVSEAGESIDDATLHETIARYHAIARKLIEQLPDGPGYTRAQTGLLVARALMLGTAGRFDEYAEEIKDALQQAYGTGDEDAVAVLETMFGDT